MTEPKTQPIYYVGFFDIDYPTVAAAMADAPKAIAALRNARRSGMSKVSWSWQGLFEMPLQAT